MICVVVVVVVVAAVVVVGVEGIEIVHFFPAAQSVMTVAVGWGMEECMVEEEGQMKMKEYEAMMMTVSGFAADQEIPFREIGILKRSHKLGIQEVPQDNYDSVTPFLPDLTL